jgi:transposase
MDEITEDAAELVARVAGLDVGKASLVCCVRVPHDTRPGRRRREVRTFATTTGQLLELRDWLVCQGVTRCVLEATSAYWKRPYYVLEDAVAECWPGSAATLRWPLTAHLERSRFVRRFPQLKPLLTCSPLPCNCF